MAKTVTPAQREFIKRYLLLLLAEAEKKAATKGRVN
jgi:hypothetical protein